MPKDGLVPVRRTPVVIPPAPTSEFLAKKIEQPPRVYGGNEK